MFILSTKMGEKKCTCVSHRIHMYKKCLKYNYNLDNMINNVIICKIK